jgi:hypothetical protein
VGWSSTVSSPGARSFAVRTQPRGDLIPITFFEDTLMSSTANGEQRKTLASQLDRLDGILDALSDGLNQAVAQAVQEAVGLAVREAVQAVLREALANPDLLALLQAAHMAPGSVGAATPAARPVPEPGLRQRLGRGWAWLTGRLAAAVAACGAGLRRVGGCVGAAWARVRPLGRYAGPLAVALGTGTVAGLGAYWAGPWLAAAWAWLGWFLAALAVQVRAAWHRLRTAVAEG